MYLDTRGRFHSRVHELSKRKSLAGSLKICWSALHSATQFLKNCFSVRNCRRWGVSSPGKLWEETGSQHQHKKNYLPSFKKIFPRSPDAKPLASFTRHTQLRAEIWKAPWRHVRLGWEGNIYNPPHLLHLEHHEHTQPELYTILCKNTNKEVGWWLMLNGGSPTAKGSERSTTTLPLPSLGDHQDYY